MKLAASYAIVETIDAEHQITSFQQYLIKVWLPRLRRLL